MIQKNLSCHQNVKSAHGPSRNLWPVAREEAVFGIFSGQRDRDVNPEDRTLFGVCGRCSSYWIEKKPFLLWASSSFYKSVGGGLAKNRACGVLHLYGTLMSASLLLCELSVHIVSSGSLGYF